MRLKIILVAVMCTASSLVAQDKLVLISQDTLDIKLLRNNSERVVFSYKGESIETDISTKFINKIILSSGRIITPLTESIRPYTDQLNTGNMARFPFSDTVDRESKLLFPNAKVIKMNIKIPQNWTEQSLLRQFSSMLSNDWKTFNKEVEMGGYLAGAFMVIMQNDGQNMKCYYYHLPVANRDIENSIRNKEFLVVDPMRILGHVTFPEKIKSSIHFNSDGTASITVDGEASTWDWSLIENNVLSLSERATNSKRKETKSIKWNVVYYKRGTLRLTAFTPTFSYKYYSSRILELVK